MELEPLTEIPKVKIDPEALHKARVEALRSKKTLGAWLEEAIEEKLEREQKKVK